jgi:transcription antitermination protein NusB
VSGPRRTARDAALQILYFWEVGGAPPEDAIETYFHEHAPDAPDAVFEFASRLVLGTVAEIGDLDALIERHSEHWRLGRLAVVDRLILRMATWELRHGGDTPPAVVLNEAIELARRFSTVESARFVNGVLDGVRRTLDGEANRPADFAQ